MYHPRCCGQHNAISITARHVCVYFLLPLNGCEDVVVIYTFASRFCRHHPVVVAFTVTVATSEPAAAAKRRNVDFDNRTTRNLRITLRWVLLCVSVENHPVSRNSCTLYIELNRFTSD